MNEKNSFTSLIVWQKSKELTLDVYQSVKTCRDYSFKDQIQRASVSVMNNIAEGYARKSDKGFRNFLQIAKGSAAEVQSMVILGRELNYLTQVQYVLVADQSVEIQKMLTAFINKLSD